MKRSYKLTTAERHQVFLIAALTRGKRWRYPLTYIAALYGLNESAVRQIVVNRGLHRSERLAWNYSVQGSWRHSEMKNESSLAERQKSD